MKVKTRKPRPPAALAPAVAGALAAAGILLTVAGCTGQLTPLGPGAAPQPRHLGSPIVLRAVLSRPPTAAGGCLAGFAALSLPAPEASLCYRPLDAPVTLTSAAIAAPVASSSVSIHTGPPGPPGPPPQGGQAGPPPQGQPAGPQAPPGLFPITVAVPAADVAAVTAVIAQAYNSGGALAISVAGKTWAAVQVDQAFPGRQFQIFLPSMSDSLQLQRILVPPG